MKKTKEVKYLEECIECLSRANEINRQEVYKRDKQIKDLESVLRTQRKEAITQLIRAMADLAHAAATVVGEGGQA